MAGKVMYSKLWNAVRMLLVLSHGQAAVERGFSVNKLAEEVHLQAETCCLCDHVRYVGGIDQVDVALESYSWLQVVPDNLYLEESKKKA